MAVVPTATGPIDADDLGLTLIHEHLRSQDEAVANQWPHLYDRDAEYMEMLKYVRSAQEHGVKTFADPAAMFLSRDAELMRRISKDTGMQVIAATGIYTYDHLPMFFQTRDEDFMADCFVHDIEQGIQGTDVKAAFIKCAADEPGVGPNIEKVHRAAARASKRTGMPIMAHTRPASNTGPRQLEILLDEEGVAPEKVQLAHTGDTDDLDYIEGVLARGVFIGMDRYGLELFLPIEKRNATVLELLKRGYADRMMLSQDFPVAFDWYSPEMMEQLSAAGAEKDWSWTLVFEQVIPALRDGGMTDEQLDQMMVKNPRRWLSGA
jgi:phosphotriesterase-related protein